MQKRVLKEGQTSGNDRTRTRPALQTSIHTARALDIQRCLLSIYTCLIDKPSVSRIQPPDAAEFRDLRLTPKIGQSGLYSGTLLLLFQSGILEIAEWQAEEQDVVWGEPREGQEGRERKEGAGKGCKAERIWLK